MASRWRMGLAALAAAALFGQTAAPAFDAASVTRSPFPQGSNTRLGFNAGGYTSIAAPLWWIVGNAYNIPFLQVVGPAWIERETYDILAKAPPGSSVDQRRAMLQTLLAQHFHLAAHRDTRETEALVMTVAKGGPRMHASGQQPAGYKITQDGDIRHMKVPATMKAFAPMLGGMLGEVVVDRTALSGVFDIAVDWDVSVPLERSDNLILAVEKQLGLKIERQKIPLDVLIVDRADKDPVKN